MLKFSEAVLKVRFHCLHRHVKAQFLSHHQKNPGPVRVHQVSVRELEFVDCFSVPMVRTLLNVPEDSEFLNCSRDFQFPADSMEFPIVKDTTPNMMNPRLYTTSYNKP